MLLSIGLAFLLRTQHLPQLGDRYLLGVDSYRLFRHARQIAEEGQLPDVDTMRYSPVGKDNSYHLAAASYLIAYSYLLVHEVWESVTIEQVAIWYPVVLFAFSLPVFFLFARLVFGYATACLAMYGLAIAPPLIHHTAAGFADRDALTLFLFLCLLLLYVYAQSAQQAIRRVVFCLACGIVTVLLGLTWPGAGLVMSLIVLTNWVSLLAGRYSHEQHVIYSVWSLSTILPLAVLTPRYRDLTDPFGLLVLVLPVVFLVFANLFFALRQMPQIHSTCFRCLLSPAITSGVYFLILAGMGSLLLGPQEVLEYLAYCGRKLLAPIGSGLMRSVEELQPPTWSDWWGSLGLVLFMAYLGSGMLFAELFSTLRLRTSGIGLIISALLSLITIALSSVLSWNWLLFLGLPGLIVSFWLCYWRYFSRTGPPMEQSPGKHHSLLLCLVWFLGFLLATQAAARFAIFFTPIVLLLASSCVVVMSTRFFTEDSLNQASAYLLAILGVWCCMIVRPGLSGLVEELRRVSTPTFVRMVPIAYWLIGALLTSLLLYRSLRKLDSTKTSYRSAYTVGWILLCFPVLLAFGGTGAYSGLLQTSYQLSAQISLDLSATWLDALAWLKTYTNQASVVAAWWDYGSWLNELGQRSTIVDEDHQYPHWISWMAAKVLCARDENQALEFLRTRKATHLLLTSAEMRKLWHISSFQTDPDLARKALVIPLRLQSVAEAPEQKHMRIDFAPASVLSEQSLLVSQASDSTRVNIAQRLSVYLSMVDGVPIPIRAEIASPTSTPLVLKRVILNHRDYSFQDGHADGCLVIRIQSARASGATNQPLRFEALYVPAEAQQFLSVRLFLLGEDIPSFQPVYPVLNFRDSPIKIWKLDYPPHIQENPIYLTTDSDCQSHTRR